MIPALASTLLAVAAALFLFWKLWFCRKPARRTPEDPKAIVSPANGRVAVVQRFDTETVTAKKWNSADAEILCQDVAKRGWFLLIVMTPLNVHYQRAPYAGEVKLTRHTRGSFLSATKAPEKLTTLRNERNEILLQTPKGKVKIVQIAGVLARRITCFVQPHQKVSAGDEIGFINLGSQTALILPDTAVVDVKPGAAVTDGETVVARWR